MKLEYDITFDLAIGQKRTQKIYRNQKWQWSTFVKKLQTPYRTSETVMAYRKMTKAQQDDIKDVGGFVGGYLIDGSRTHVKHRQLVCLDIDFGDISIWDNYVLLYGTAGLLYTTHKHTPETPRLRLIIPLDRTVTPDEYKAIARKIASNLGIDAFDDTTYQPQRMMYWQSTPKDGEYLCKYHDSPILHADNVLQEYEDWRDVSSWAISSRGTKQLTTQVAKQQNPLDKEGLIGAFCRTYDIHQAIAKFVPDYVACDVPNRYTYIQGSTSAGVITYDDMFSYSHHATDPASEQLCNAFDIVRLHTFHDLDKEAKDNTPANRMPSFIAMSELAQQDPEVKKTFVTSNFDNECHDAYSDSLAWIEDLVIDKRGVPKPTIKNACILINNDPRLKDAFAYNEFSRRISLTRSLPWRGVSQTINSIRDADDSGLRRYLEDKYSYIGKASIADAVTCIAVDNSYHPVREYLNDLVWDTIPRLDTLFIDYLGADDNAYTRAVTRKALTGAVKRIYEPGCKFDTMLVLVGSQGAGKSYLLNRIAVNPAWFNDSITTVRGKEAFEALQGYWIIEMAELTATRKSEIESVKQYISSTSDNYRSAYGHYIESNPRQCVFFGTTNDDEFLRDYTGNRRFLPVHIHKSHASKDIFVDLTDTELAQIWAEAVYRYRANESLYLCGDILAQAVILQQSHTADSPYSGIIQEALQEPIPKKWYAWTKAQRQDYLLMKEDYDGEYIERDRVCLLEIWEEILGRRTRIMRASDRAELRAIMSGLGGWIKNPKSTRYGAYGIYRNGYKKRS